MSLQFSTVDHPAQPDLAEPETKERGSVSRSTVATKDARDLSKARFRAEPLRVTDPRSDKFVQRAKSFTNFDLCQSVKPWLNFDYL